MSKAKNSFINSLYLRSPIFVKNLFATLYGFVLHRKRHKEHYFSTYKLLKETEFLSTEQLKEIQLPLLKDFLVFSYNNSEFYKAIFDENNFNPEKLTCAEDLKSLPIISKSDVERNIRKINCSHLFTNVEFSQTSGGTRGNPLKLFITNECAQKGEAYMSLLYSWYDLSQKRKMAKCAGQVICSPAQKKPPYWVTDLYNKSLYLSSFNLSEDNLLHYVKKLEKFNPDVIEGYPSSLYLLALAAKYYKKQINPMFVRTGSESLLDYQREAIEGAFNCKVHNFYGSGENCVKAIECHKGKIHFQLLYGYTEFLNEKGEQASLGERARVVATGFSNYAFPLIRYDHEDLVVLNENQQCVCGRGGVLVDKIIGRLGDFLITPGKKRVSMFPKLFAGLQGVVNAQFVQNREDEVELRLVTTNKLNTSNENIIINNARETLGNEIQIKIRYVNEIKKEKNGKFKFIISNITKEFLGEKLTN